MSSCGKQTLYMSFHEPKQAMAVLSEEHESSPNY